LKDVIQHAGAVDGAGAVRHDRHVSAQAHRLPPRRSGVRLWTMRFLGLTATGALLAVGLAAALMVLPDRNDAGSAALEGTPSATPQPAAEPAKERKPRLSAGQRRQRAAAIAVLRDQGYRPVGLADYKFGKDLRVLVGRGDGGQRAFFFAGGSFVGNDTLDDSMRIRVVRAGNRSVTLSYRLFSEGDQACCPSGGSARVLFRWDGETLAPQTSVPLSTQRRAPVG
jgi:hypothetical protein